VLSQTPSADRQVPPAQLSPGPQTPDPHGIRQSPFTQAPVAPHWDPVSSMQPSQRSVHMGSDSPHGRGPPVRDALSPSEAPLRVLMGPINWARSSATWPVKPAPARQAWRTADPTWIPEPMAATAAACARSRFVS
jgi:hypothetical protein